MAALIYLLVGMSVYSLVSDNLRYQHPVVYLVIGWGLWPPVLLLALWGLWRGSTVNKVFAILALCLEGLVFLSSIVWM